MTTTTCMHESTALPRTASITLLLAFELGERSWKLGFTTGLGQRPRIRQVAAGAVDQVLEEIARAKRRLQLPADTPVISCYEAGRDGFWLHRYLMAHGVTNSVVDSSSIEVNRRARRAKTDRLDLAGLLSLLARYVAGDQRVWRIVRVPSVAEEDARQLHRTWESVQQDRSRLLCRLQGLLVTHGVRVPIDATFLERVERARVWDGTPLPRGLKDRIGRVWAQLALLNEQLAALEAARRALVADPQTATGRYAEALPTLRGIGPIGAWVLATEIFGWRQIQNRRQLGALVAWSPRRTKVVRRRTIRASRARATKHVRRLMVQLAWSWVRYQPQSVR